MTTELLEFDRWSTTDTDLSPPKPDKAEQAKAEVVRAWSIDRKSPTWRFFSHLHLSGEESYDLDPEPWRRFDRLLSTYVTVSHLHMTFPTDVIEKRTPFSSLFASLGANLEKDDRRRRYAELSSLLDEWANDPSDFDASVAPLIEEALRDTAPRHFPDK